MSANVVPFAIIFVLALAFFVWSCYGRFRLLTLGKKENRFDHVGRRFLYMLFFAFGQRRVISKLFGLNHFVLFWSFIILAVANIEFLLSGLFPNQISLSRLPDGAFHASSYIFDVASILVLLAIIIAVIRRLVFPPLHIDARSRDAFIILSMVAILMIAFFMLHASEIAHGEVADPQHLPISDFVATSILSGLSAGTLDFLVNLSWWIHAIVLLGFLNYLPYSKHLHILTAIPNCFFRSPTKVCTQPREEFITGNSFGAGQVDHFTWKSLMDSYACAECGRCSDVCPATATGKALDPRMVIHEIKTNLFKNGSLIAKNSEISVPLIGGGQEGSISEDVIWDCTTCGACMQVCPVFIEHVPKIIEMRRNLVEMKSEFPHELLAFFENMEQRSNPWGMAPAERTRWAANIDVKPFDTENTEYLFFVGCAGAFDARNRKVTVAISKILDKCNISWGILGKDEMCCGDSLRRLGNEYVFENLVLSNVKTFKEKGIRKIITQCPHCYSTLKNDYRQYGVELEVVHHVEVINNLLKDFKLTPEQIKELGNLVFHDSCYLGRYNQIYNAPREVIASATGQAPIELRNHHDNSFCCGAGGGRMWMEEQRGKHINVTRLEEAMEKNPRTVCVSCPYCMTMFEDGLKDKNAEGDIQVLDIAEIVARGIT